MNKKNRFKLKNKKKEDYSENTTNQQKPKVESKEYNMKSDFVNLSIIIIVFTGLLFGLYYYDLQSNILANTTEQILSLL